MPGFWAVKVGAVALALNFFVTSSAVAGIEHRWSDSAKEAVSTAYGSKSSKVWFTVGKGILNEVYYPRIDRAQVGDSQILFSNVGGKLFLEEKRDFIHKVSHPSATPRPVIQAMYGNGGQRIAFTKEIITDPENPVLRIRYRFHSLPHGTQIYVLHKPTADNDGAHDNGRVLSHSNGKVLLAWDSEPRNPTFQALITTSPVLRASVGVVGDSDGWQDLARHGRMTIEQPANGPANIALTAQVEPAPELEILIGFGSSPNMAVGALEASLRRTYNEVRSEFDRGWAGYIKKLATAPWLNDLPQSIIDDLLWNAAVVKAHEDKSSPGAIVASLSIPHIPDGMGHPDGKWTGGYHLVWPRDLFKSALALLRLGDTQTALNALRFMARMEHDGKMAQNTWVDGRPFWTGQQMDQEAFPILLAFELMQAGVGLEERELREFVARRVSQVYASSGWTGQERWEEASGFSPNTLAVMAGALSRIGDAAGAKRLLETALSKTVSRQGPLSNAPYFIRITQHGMPDAGHYLHIANGGPSLPEFRIVDGGFLEWLRWFPDPEKYFGDLGRHLSSVIRGTLPVYDNPRNGVASSFNGIPLYRRYTGDAYGMYRQGGAWPILTAERALPELLHNPREAFRYLRHVRDTWGPGDMCPEQVTDTLKPMPFGASPLVWCHAEMVELAYRATKQLKR